MIDNDDLPVGRILSRREALALLGFTSSAVLLSGCVPIRSPEAVAESQPAGSAGSGTTVLSTPESTNASSLPACVVRPELTEGPLFVEEALNRSDIRLDPSNNQMSDGAQLDLTFRVTTVGNGGCTPLEGVQVDVWHCDAQGIYSDTNQLGMNTVGQKFLRGYQITDANGIATFTTIYPGWYVGRAVHIHFKMRTGDGYDFTSQLFFDEALTSDVYKQPPYASRGEPAIKLAGDGIYRQSGGQMMLTVETVETGYTATFDVGLQLS